MIVKNRAVKNEPGLSKRIGRRGEHLVLLQGLLVAIYIMVPVWPDLKIPEHSEALFIIRRAALLTGIVTGAIFGIGGSLGIRRYLTPLPYPVEHNRLVESGVYSLVRHPLYSAQIFAAVGWAIFTLSLSHLLVTLVAALFFSYKASKEEAWLTELHPEYREYVRRVGKFVPGVGKKR